MIPISNPSPEDLITVPQNLVEAIKEASENEHFWWAVADFQKEWDFDRSEEIQSWYWLFYWWEAKYQSILNKRAENVHS